MTLVRRIEKQINQSVSNFCIEVANKYQIPEKELQVLWKVYSTKSSKITNENDGRKKSAYMNFCRQKRIEIKQNQPHLSFGDVTKEIAKIWQSLSIEEKESFRLSSEEPLKESHPTNVESAEMDVDNDLNDLNIKELKNICKEKGFKVKGIKEKEALIQLIKNAEKS